jgi:tetratricopeptide (TPR) repeat protein
VTGPDRLDQDADEMQHGDPVLNLATALSVAVRVEPELIRAVRLALFPRIGVETEADLWFSDFVRSQGRSGVVFDTAERRRLQRRLGRWLRQQPDAPVHSLWQIVERVHGDLSPALLLEERVTWLAVSDRPGEIDDELAPAFKAVAQESRDGLKRWLASAWDRLPQAVRDSSTGWQLAQVARPHFAPGRFPSAAGRAPVSARQLGDLARVLGDVRITVRRDGGELEVDGGALAPGTRPETPSGTYALPVPDTAPRLLTLLSEERSGRDLELSVPVNSRVRVPIRPGPLRLRNGRGHVFLVPDQPLPARRGGLRGRFIGIVMERYDHDSLPPLTSSPNLVRQLGDALGDTNYATEYLAGPSLRAIMERLSRLRVANGGPLIVYFRGYAGFPDGSSSGGGSPRIALRDSDPESPQSFLPSETLFRACAASGADQILVILDTVRAPNSDGRWVYPPPKDLDRAAWTGTVTLAAPYDELVATEFGPWLARLLRRGPDQVPQGRGWSPRSRFIHGGDLMRAVVARWPKNTPATPRNFAAGVPTDLLPNPRYALRPFPPELSPAEFGPLYVSAAASFLREVIADVTTSVEDRETAVGNMLRLGVTEAVQAAVALDELANGYAVSGRLTDAAAALRTAIGLLRPLVERHPARTEPTLARALYSLASRQSEAYRWSEARPAVLESVALLRRMVDHDPQYRPRLAESLHLLSAVLQNSGQNTAALGAATDAVELFRRLALEDPTEHLSALAASLVTLANRSGAAGRSPEALNAAIETVTIHRTQANADPAAQNQAALAQSLHFRWFWERNLELWHEAHMTITECVALRRSLAVKRPETHPQLAEALNCLAISFADLERTAAAVAASREGVGIYADLVARGAVDLRQHLARSLRNNSMWLCTLGRPQEAVSAASAAVELYRDLDAELSRLHQADLADAFEAQSHALDLLGDGRPRAADAARQAVRIYRELATAQPEMYRRHLAQSLNTLSIRVDALGHSAEAAQLREEVRTIVAELGEGL